MTTVELETLVVRLVGDVSGYLQSMQKAQEGAKETAAKVEQSAQQIQQVTESVKSFASTAAGVMGAIGLGGFLQSSFNSYARLESETLRLNTAISMNGQEVTATMAQYEQFAASVSNATLTTRGQTMAMLRQAETMGMTGDAAQNVVRNSIALASARGVEAQSMVRMAVQLEQGNVRMLRHTLGMNHAASETEVLARAQTMLASGLAQAQAMTTTAEGQMTRLKNSVEALKKELGKVVAEALVPLIPIVQNVVNLFRNMDASTKRWIGAALGAIAAVAALSGLVGTFKIITGAVFGFIKSLVTMAFQILIVLPLTILWKTVTGLLELAMLGLRAAVFVVNAVIAAFNFILTLTSGVGIVLVLAGIALVVLAVWGLVSAFSTIASVVAGAFDAAWSGIRQFFTNIWEIIGPTVEHVRDQFTGLFGTPEQQRQMELGGVHMGQAVNRGLGREMQKMQAVLSGSAEALHRIAAFQDRMNAANAGTGAGGEGGMFGGRALQAGRNLWEAVRVAAISTWDQIQEWAGNVWDQIEEWAQEAWNWIRGPATTFWDWLQLRAGQAWDIIVTLLGRAVNRLLGIPNEGEPGFVRPRLEEEQSEMAAVLQAATGLQSGGPQVSMGSAWFQAQAAAQVAAWQSAGEGTGGPPEGWWANALATLQQIADQPPAVVADWDVGDW